MNPRRRSFFLLVNLAGIVAGIAFGVWLFGAVTH